MPLANFTNRMKSILFTFFICPLFCTYLLLTTCLLFTTCFAQEQLTTLPAATKGTKHNNSNNNTQADLETITVTAQKHQQKLLDVPVAMTLLQQEQIDMAFANNIEELQQLVPTLSFRKGNTTRNSALTIRGIGTISFSIAAEPSVSTVIDDVVLGRSGQAFSGLYDIERIEVLRGPQGTLFGKNASAGVVNIITKNPDDYFNATLKTTYFQQDEYQISTRLSGPLGEHSSASLSLLRSGFNGHLTNVYNDTKVDGYSHLGARGILLYKNNGRHFKLILEHFNGDDNCCTDVEGLPSGRNIGSAAQPDSEGVINGVADIDLGQRLVDHDFKNKTKDKTNALSFHLEQTIANHNFTAISAYRRWENTEIREGDFSSSGGKVSQPVDFSTVFFQLHDIGPQEWQQVSQEFRLTSPNNPPNNNQSYAINQYQLGAFFWYQKSDRSFTRFASCQNDKGQNQLILLQNPGLTCLATDIVDASAQMSTKFINYALYGGGQYPLSSKLSLLYGLRYGHDRVSYHHIRVNNDPYGRVGVGVQGRDSDTRLKGNTSENKLSLKLGAQFNLSPNSRVYGHWSQGHKGPGFNVYYNMKPTETAALDAEQSDAFELGFKYTKDNLLLNTALFYTLFTGFQANNFDCSTGVCITRLTNAGDVSTQGLEADFFWQADDNIEFYGGISLVKAEIDKFNCPLNQECTNRSGLEVPFSPDIKYSIAANYFIPGDFVRIKLNTAFTYTDEQYAELPDNQGIFNPRALLPDYGLWNASIHFSFADDKYQLAFIAKNLANNSYTNTYSGNNFRYKIPRNADRYFGISLQVMFE